MNSGNASNKEPDEKSATNLEDEGSKPSERISKPSVLDETRQTYSPMRPQRRYFPGRECSSIFNETQPNNISSTNVSNKEPEEATPTKLDNEGSKPNETICKSPAGIETRQVDSLMRHQRRYFPGRECSSIFGETPPENISSPNASNKELEEATPMKLDVEGSKANEKICNSPAGIETHQADNLIRHQRRHYSVRDCSSIFDETLPDTKTEDACRDSFDFKKRKSFW